MDEVRRHERVRTFLGAQIIFNHGQSTLECQIRNISAGGAKLLVSETVTLPNEFELRIPQRGRSYRARLRWRSSEAVGVEFVIEDAQTAPGSGDDLASRLQELESENEVLRKRVRALMLEIKKIDEGGVREVA